MKFILMKQDILFYDYYYYKNFVVESSKSYNPNEY